MSIKSRVMYSSHPISNYSVGRFQFDNSVLTLESDEDVKEFEELYSTMPPAEKNRIKKIDIDAAEQLVQSILAQQPKPVQTIDSSLGGEATRSIGAGDLTDSNPPETGSDDSLQSNTNYSNAGEDAPSTMTDFVPNRDLGANPGVITNNEVPAGSGDTTSGENHGAGNFDGANNQDQQELKQIAAGQVTGSNEDQKAALDLLAESGVKQEPEESNTDKVKPDSEAEQTEADLKPADKPKLGGLNLNRTQ